MIKLVDGIIYSIDVGSLSQEIMGLLCAKEHQNDVICVTPKNGVKIYINAEDLKDVYDVTISPMPGDGWQYGSDYLCAMVLLSECGFFIASGECTGIGLVQKLAKSRQHQSYIFDLGLYE